MTSSSSSLREVGRVDVSTRSRATAALRTEKGCIDFVVETVVVGLVGRVACRSPPRVVAFSSFSSSQALLLPLIFPLLLPFTATVPVLISNRGKRGTPYSLEISLFICSAALCATSWHPTHNNKTSWLL